MLEGSGAVVKLTWKPMEIKVAIWLRSASRAICAIAYVMPKAAIGSSRLAVPLSKKASPGSNWSLARARKRPADVLMPIRAEKPVTAHSPAKITFRDKLVSGMMLVLERSDSCVMLDAIDRTTMKYTMNVDKVAHNVPFGMALLGFLRSPDMDAPAKIPAVAL